MLFRKKPAEERSPQELEIALQEAEMPQKGLKPFLHKNGKKLVAVLVVHALKKDFVSFLENDVPKNPLKAEYFLPFVVNDQIRDGKADVTVLKSADKWFGVTYKADKPVVMAALAEMMQNGTYPDPLWK